MYICVNFILDKNQMRMIYLSPVKKQLKFVDTCDTLTYVNLITERIKYRVYFFAKILKRRKFLCQEINFKE